MTREFSLLSSKRPTAIAPAPGLHIAHVQLRDLIICPRERGLVNYVTQNSVVEQDLYAPRSTPRSLFDLSFFPANLTSLEVMGGNATLFAAGGQEAELHMSLHHHSTRQRRTGAIEWKFEEHLQASINNSLLLTSFNLGRSNESSVEPRLVISNNDCSVKFFDIAMAVRGMGAPKIRQVGTVRLDVAVNHSSISPDGTCLLSVGDSSKVVLHRIHGGSHLSFTPIATLTVPPPNHNLSAHFSSSLTASFSTAFARDGTKYAVASQEGVVCVWDVRSTKPLKVFQTDKSDILTVNGNGMASGYLSDDPYEWTRGLSKAPGWSARNIKFGSGGGNACGKEIMTFTEHTSLLHVIDARTFETEEIIRVPSIASKSRPESTTAQPSSRRHTITGSSPRVTQTRNRSSYVRPYQRPPPNARALAASIVNANARHLRASPTSHLSNPSSRREAPHVLLALEDTFRIPSRSIDPERGPSGSSDSSGPQRRRDPEEDLVVIPPLGDREVEADVRALLGSHGIRSRRVGAVGVAIAGQGEDDEDYEERNDDSRMQVDELDAEPEMEWDCVPSRLPSRSSSPSPSATSGTYAVNRWRAWPRLESVSGARSQGGNEGHMEDESEEDEDEDQNDDQDRCRIASEYNPDLDLAGTCFDPTGGYIYAATTEGVVEWNVRGSDKKWWSDSVNVWR